MDEARGERGRHPMHHAPVGLAVAAGNQRRALGELVFADFPVENKLVQRRLYHRDGGRQLFEVDEPAAWIVGRGQEGRGRPTRAVGAVAPGDAAEIDGIEQKRPDVDVAAVRGRRDLLGDHRFGRAGWAPGNTRLAGLDQEGEHFGELARAQRVVRGDGGGLGHGRAPNDGETARTPSPGARPSPPPGLASSPGGCTAHGRRDDGLGVDHGRATFGGVADNGGSGPGWAAGRESTDGLQRPRRRR